MQRILLCSLICVAFIMIGYGQTSYASHKVKDKSLYQLEWKLETGNSRYLRDIASFLDKSEDRDFALEILMKKTIFPSSQINLSSSTTKEEFYDFFYTYQKEIKYSHILQIYYTVPLEQIEKNIESSEVVSISPMDAFSKLCLDLQNLEGQKEIKQKILALRNIQIHKGVALNKLLTCLDLSNKDIQDALIDSKAIIYLASKEDLLESMQQVIEESKSNPRFVNEIYKHIFDTNDQDLSIAQIQSALDQFKLKKMSLKDTIDSKIEHQYNVSNKYYYSDVDFYGTTLCTKLKKNDKDEPLIANLLATKDPKLLFYLAAYLFKKGENNIDPALIKLIENLSLVKVNVENKDNYVKDVLIYWSKNYHSYTWDESVWRFVSEAEKMKQTKNLERLIRRLNSKNDTVAVNAYMALTEANPFEVTKLVKKYKKVMKGTNPLIPPLKYNYLETTTQLVAYNKEFEIPHKPSLPLQQLLDRLDQNLTEKERVEVENRIIAISEIKDLPSLEYWGIVHAINKENSFSIGRIVELVLVKFWDKMKYDRQWLTHFIYKAALFNQLDGTGLAKSYNNLINLNDEGIRETLNYIQLHSSRQDVMDYIQEEIFDNEHEESHVKQKAVAAKVDLIQKLKIAKEVKYSQINQLLDFEGSLTTEKAQTLSFVKKLSPKKDIRKLKIKDALNVEDLAFLKEETYSHREVGSILRFFNNEDPKANLIFALEMIRDFEIADKAYVVNSLFRYKWFTQFINESKFISQEMTQLITILSQYLKEAEFIGEIEDRTTQINIIQTSLIGRSIEEQLVASIELDVDLALKSDLQKTILAKATFEDLGVILDHVDGLINNKGNLDLGFLNEDFGLPIFDISTNSELKTFLERHKTMTKQEFYTAYLEDFGIDFRNKAGKLDYDKIMKILKYDIAQPFIGRGGGKRDYYVYGLTKVLESELNETLGFEDKLNNYQTFVHFSGLNCARAWYTYLVESGYGKKTQDLPSFTN